MSHTINMLAKRNIQKYKKHYLIVLIVLLIVSTFIFSSFFIVDNLYQMKKNYYISTYGSWYTRIENIDEQTQKGIEIYSKDYFKDITFISSPSLPIQEATPQTVSGERYFMIRSQACFK